MKHIPVLKNEVIEAFSYLKNQDGFFVDCTIGAGGHSLAIVNTIDNPRLKFIGIDKDKNALDLANKNILESGHTGQFILIHDDFKNINEILAQIVKENRIEELNIAGILIDLGISSMQLDEKGRGFSFSSPEAELDMRMNQEEKILAKDIVNDYPEERLAKIFFEYGEEQFSRSIAKNICQSRKDKPVNTVGDLIAIVERSIPAKIRLRGGKHFATKTFQALRIEVNKELVGLDNTLKLLSEKLKSSAKLAVISFHSLEDRIVKNVFRELAEDCICPPLAPVCTCNIKPQVKILTKKPIVPSEDEVANNPRSRSAKLRIIEKI